MRGKGGRGGGRGQGEGGKSACPIGNCEKLTCLSSYKNGTFGLWLSV